MIVLVAVLIGAATGGSPSSGTTTVTVAAPAPAPTVRTITVAPSVECAPGTHLSSGFCYANAPRVRTVPGPTKTVTVTTASPSSAPSQTVEDVGSSDHSTDAEFCAAHQCIGDFTGEGGTIVQCQDGTYSHAGGISGACSSHGGEL